MELMTVKEVSKVLKVSRQAVCKAISEGRIKALKVGKRYRISKDWLEEYLKNGGDNNGK